MNTLLPLPSPTAVASLLIHLPHSPCLPIFHTALGTLRWYAAHSPYLLHTPYCIRLKAANPI